MRRFGKTYAHPLIVLVALPSQADNSRFGIVAGKTLGKAVQRNRAKRLLRAALQPSLPAIKPGWDILLIARRRMVGATYEQTQAALTQLLHRSHLLQEVHAT